jgi:opacity protein-like surface antigen
LHFSYQADDKISVFSNAGIAFNFLKITNMDLTASGQTVTQEMDVAYGIGFKIGGGILIKQKASISIDYLALGNHDFDGRIESSGYSEAIDGEGKVDLVTLTLGIKF